MLNSMSPLLQLILRVSYNNITNNHNNFNISVAGMQGQSVYVPFHGYGFIPGMFPMVRDVVVFRISKYVTDNFCYRSLKVTPTQIR